MRLLTLGTARALAAISQLTLAAERKASEKPARPASSEAFSAEKAAARGDEVRRNDEARQQAWEKKVKSITRGICIGC